MQPTSARTGVVANRTGVAALPDPHVMAVQQWIDDFVVHFQLCPFATQVVSTPGSVHYAPTLTESSDELIACLDAELNYLDSNPGVITAFVIHPHVLTDFMVYNQFLNTCDDLLTARRDQEVYQIVGFHPDYQFADTAFADAENFANRAPFPMLHILREATVEQAIDEHPDIESIPRRNIEVLNAQGTLRLQERWLACREKAGLS